MLIMISSEGKTLESQPSLRFGRTPFFIKYNLEKDTWEAFQNNAIEHRGGAGIKAAQMMLDHKITHVLTGQFGPNAHQALSAAGIKMVTFDSVYNTVSDVVQAFKNNHLTEIK
jgi:predicted Fe-Mo cluster-binding NifX family protein